MSSLQPAILDHLVVVPKIWLKTPKNEFTFLMEIRKGVFEINSDGKQQGLDYKGKLDQFNMLVELNQGLFGYDWQLSPFQTALVEHLIENIALTA